MARPRPLQPTAIAVIVAYPASDGIRVLALERRGGAFAGCWNLVTGMIEEGETAIEAALRELLEETQIVPDALYTAERVDYFYDPIADAVQVAPIFVAVLDAKPAVVLDGSHERFAWLTPEKAATTLSFAIHRDVALTLGPTVFAGEPASWRRFR